MTFRSRSGRLAAAVTLALLIGLPSAGARASSSTFYLDCSRSSTGTGTAAEPWGNVAGPNGHRFSPGDALLLRRGTRCNGPLWPKGQGASGSPITVGAYGNGARPMVDAGGGKAALRLRNQHHWVIQDLQLVGWTQFGQTRRKDGTVVSIQENEGLLYRELR